MFEGYVQWCNPIDYVKYGQDIGLDFTAITEFVKGGTACLAVCINVKNHGGAYPAVGIWGGHVDSPLMSYEKLNGLKGLFLTDGCATLIGDVFSFTGGNEKRLKYRVKRVPAPWEYRRIIKLYVNSDKDIIECYKVFDILEDLAPDVVN